MDRDHLRFVSDNDSRETIETWEACFAEGVRGEKVEMEVPPVVKRLHEESLPPMPKPSSAPAAASEEGERDKEKWVARDGANWKGAFGGDVDSGSLEDGSQDGEVDDGGVDESLSSDEDEVEDVDANTNDGEVDLGISDASHSKGKLRETRNSVGDSNSGDEGGNYTWRTSSGASNDRSLATMDSTATGSTGATDMTSKSASSSKNPIKVYKDYRSRSRDLHRKHRGLMQW